MGRLQYKEIPLIGKWCKAQDPLLCEETDFKDIENLRPYDRGYRAVNGMSKINSTALSTYLKARAGFHFAKENPSSESHVLVQAWNAAETASKVWENTTAIPSAGDFSATELMDESSATVGKGRFSDAPNGQVAYCNSVDAPQIWAGNETHVAAFVSCSAAPINSVTNPRDFTKEVNNDLTTADEVAIIGGGDDSNADILLHMDGADNSTTITDSGEATPGWTCQGAAALDADQRKFGSASLRLTGAAGCYVDADAADDAFHLGAGSGAFTIDFWIRFNSLPSDGNSVGIYEEYTDVNNYILIYANNVGGTYYIQMDVDSGGDDELAITATIPSCAIDTWYHIAFVRGYGGSTSDWRCAVNGTFGSQGTGDGVVPDLNQTPYIGYSQHLTAYFDGWIDEFRISTVARWTANFTPPSRAYFGADAYFLIGTTRPADGFKFYIQTGGGNTESGTLTIRGWNGTAWMNWTDTDSTSGLASTGTFTLDSNVDESKPRYLNGRVLYWYYGYLTAGGATIYKVTADLPWQNVRNLWDGTLRTPLAFFFWDNSANTYIDYTLDVNVDAGSAYSAGPTANLSSLAANVDYVLIGFAERQRAILVSMFQDNFNATADTDLTLYWWNGSAWQFGTSLNDETSSNDKSLAKSGVITWEPPEKAQEFRTEINNSPPLYFYKLVFDATLTADAVKVDRVFGIAEGDKIKPHKFPIMHRGRLFLCSETDADKNAILPSAPFAPDVYNGPNAGAKLYVGDDKEVTAAASFYTRYGADMFHQMVICKKNETWLLDGDSYTGANPWRLYKVSSIIGCPAPNTMVVCDIGHAISPNILKQVVIWLSDIGPVVFDGNTIQPVGEDIGDYWNPVKTSICLVTSQMVDAYGWYDPQYQEYHLSIPTAGGTTNNTELVFDLRRKKWTKINRGTVQYLQTGFQVRDTDGKVYTYGTSDNGFLYRLENGNAWLTTAITSYFETVDIPLSGSFFNWHLLEYMKLICVSKASTPDDTITVTVYKDTETSGTNVGTFVNEESGQRCVINVEPAQVIAGVTHRVKVSVAVSDVAEGFEPLAIGYAFKVPEDEPEVVD